MEYSRLAMIWLLPIVSAVFFVLSILKKDDLPHAVYLFRITLSGVVGFYTNWIAIKMLFHPHDPLPLSHWQGLIPKNREKLAVEIGREIRQKLLSPEIITEYVMRENLVGKLGKAVSSRLLNWLEVTENRKRVERWVGRAIQSISKDSLDPTIDAVLNSLTKSLGDEKKLLSIMDMLRRLLEWLIGKEEFQNQVNSFVASLARESLDDDGAVGQLISKFIEDLGNRIENKQWQKSTTQHVVEFINRIGREQIESVFDYSLDQLETTLGNSAKTEKIVETLTSVLSSLASNRKVVSFFVGEVVTLLRRNSDVIGHIMNETIKENSGGFLGIGKVFKAIFLPEKKIVSIIHSISTDRAFRSDLESFLLEKANSAQSLLNHSTQKKLITVISKNRQSIVEWCETQGREHVATAIEGLLKSKSFWKLVQNRLEEYAPRIKTWARSMVPQVIGYIRVPVEEYMNGPAFHDWLVREQKTLAGKLSSGETVSRVAGFIEAHRTQMDELLDTKFRPWLAGVASRVLSSDDFWSWIETRIVSWSPRTMHWLETTLQKKKILNIAHSMVPSFTSELQLDKIVEEQVNRFSTDELEGMVNDVSGENLAGIEVFGGILGLAVGTLTVVNECWYYAAGTLGVFGLWAVAEYVTYIVKKKAISNS